MATTEKEGVSLPPMRKGTSPAMCTTSSTALFTETPPCMREDSYCSIQEAIDQFNTAFAE